MLDALIEHFDVPFFLVLRSAQPTPAKRRSQVLDALIEHFGTQAELARRLGVDRAAVNQWAKTGLPARRAVEIERLTGGEFKAVDLMRGYGGEDQNV